MNSGDFRVNIKDMKIIYGKTTYRNVAFRALISVVMGVVLVAWPDVALKSLVMFIGFLFLFSGILASVISYRKQQMEEQPGSMLSMNGLGSIILGALLISVPLFFTTILMFLLGGILVMAAIAQLATLSMARQFGNVSPVNYIYPVLILLAGMIVIFRPWGSAAYVVVILGYTAIFYGITDLIRHYQINKLRKQYDVEHPDRRADIEDADYEEVD